MNPVYHAGFILYIKTISLRRKKAARLLYRAAMEKKNRKSDENIGFTAAYRMSMYSPARALFMLRTAQNLPHMEQVSL